jgi:hypothetical protein
MPQHVMFPRVVHVMIEPAGPPKNDPLKYDVWALAELATSAKTLANNILFNISARFCERSGELWATVEGRRRNALA